MPTLPALDLKTNINNSPHLVILGAGASKAAFPKGDAKGKSVLKMFSIDLDKSGSRIIEWVMAFVGIKVSAGEIYGD